VLLTASLLLALPAAQPAAAPVVQTPVALAPSADGKLLYVVMSGGSPDGAPWLCVWDLAKPELRAVVPGLPGRYAGEIVGVSGTDDGTRAVVLIGDRWHCTRAEVWSVAEKKRLRELTPPGEYGGQVAIAPDVRTIASRGHRDAKAVRVWSAETGEQLADVQKAVAETEGSFAFTSDSKKLVVASSLGYAEYDLATGKKDTSWVAPKRELARGALEREYRAIPTADGRAVLAIGFTGKRFVSEYSLLVTEKGTHALGEFRHSIESAAFAPNGKSLVLSHQEGNGGGTYSLELGADHAPRLLKEVEADAKQPKWAIGNAVGAPAWRAWAVGDSTRAGYSVPPVIAFAPNGARLFAANRLGRVTVHDTEKRALAVTLFVAPQPKTGTPEWHIITPARDAVGSATEAAALEKDGFKLDAAKVRAALGAK
jgi:hypothetical protein